MKRIFTLLFILCIFISQPVKAEEDLDLSNLDYIKEYRNLQEANFSYIHGIDPEQYYDMQNYAYTPYPLFRLNSSIYFKKKHIEPGYYNLTPREHDGKWYVLFKDNGKVKYYIPCYNRDIVPETFYDTHLPKPKRTFTQNVHIKFVSAVGTISKASKRRPAPNTYLEVHDLDNEYLSIVVYYGFYRYHMIFKLNPDY